MSQLAHELAFLQGDDASRIFSEFMYPKGKSYGTDTTMRNAIQELIRHAPGDFEPRVFVLEHSDSWLHKSASYGTKDHVLVWNFAYNWVGLYLKVSRKQAKDWGQALVS